MSKKETSIKKNFGYQMVYEILVLLLPIATSPYLSRVLGAEMVGTYSYSYNIAYYFVMFSMLGIKNYGNRSIAKVRDSQQELNRTFSEIFILHAIVSLLSFAIYIMYVRSLKDNALYALIQAAYVLSAFFDISWFYFGIEKFKITVIRDSIVKILTVICIFTFVKNQDDLWIYCLIMALGMLLSQIALWFTLNRYVHVVKPTVDGIKKHLPPLLILFIPVIASSLYKYMDKIILGAMHSKTQLGYFENAEKIVNIPLTVIVAFGNVMLPKMSNLAEKNDIGSTSRYMNLSVQLIMCLAVGLSFGLAGVGKIFAPLFWGIEFTVSGELIIGLAFTIPFISLANIIRTQYLIPQSKDKEYLFSLILGAAINLLINLALVPLYGAYGSVIATLAAEIVVCIVQVIIVRKNLPIGGYLKYIAPYFIVGVLMFVGVVYIGKIGKSNIVTLLLQIFFGAVFYCGCCCWYLIYMKNEIVFNILNRIKSILRSKKQN